MLDRLLEAEGMNKNRPYIVIHPSASCPSRLWRSDRYAKVADVLAKKWDVDVILVSGGGNDKLFTHRVENFMQTRSLNLAGKLTLGMLVWILKRSRLVISNDSGPAHIAAGLDVPLIAIFGRNQAGLSPRRWRPLGPQSSYIQKDVGCIECAAHNCDLGFLCLDEVTVDNVLLETERRLEKRLVG